MNEYILEMEGITKRFPGVTALEAVTFKVKRGEVHALVGENGAGKSTLMKILNGVYQADEGKVRVDGKEVKFHNTNDARASGVSLIFQEFNLVSSLSAAENTYLGRLKSNKYGMIDWKEVNKSAGSFLESLDFKIKADTPVEQLSVAEKQMVEIAKALSVDAKIIVMDEPTATLTEKEIEKLFKIIKNLKEKGVTIVYISHRLEEIFSICDRVTVLRDGKVIDTMNVGETNKTIIIEKMVGRSIDMEFPERESNIGDVILEIRGLNRKNALKNINFTLHSGEILGIAGLVGSGRTELARAIFGADRSESGEIRIKGRTVKIVSTVSAKQNSIALVPEDRKDQGLVVDFSILYNITICNLKKVLRNKWILSKKREISASEKQAQKLSIKTPSIYQKVSNLSGGNQQKVVLAKWLFADADILILDEPTRGIDVGAKYEIYLLMNEMVREGKSIIMISSELPEVLAMSDRVLVMSNGEVKGCFDKEAINAEIVMKTAIG